MDKNVDRFSVLWKRVKQEIPAARIVKHKDSVLMTVVHWILANVLRQKRSYGLYATTIGRTIHVPNSFDRWPPFAKYVLLRHELVHLRQFRSWPLSFLNHRGLWRINALIMALCYLFVLPVKWTLRAKFERAGYEQTILALVECAVLDPNSDTHKAGVAADMETTFGGGAYFYMARKGQGTVFAYETFRKIVNGSLRSDPRDVAL